MALYRECCFRIVQNFGEKSYFRSFRGDDRPNRPPLSAPGQDHVVSHSS